MDPRSKQLVSAVTAVRQAVVLLERGCPMLAPYIREAATHKYTPLRRRIAWRRLPRTCREWIWPPPSRDQTPRQGYTSLTLEVPMPLSGSRVVPQGRFAIGGPAFSGLCIRVDADRIGVGWLWWKRYRSSLLATVADRFPPEQECDAFMVGRLVDEILSDRLVLIGVVTLDHGYEGNRAGARWMLADSEGRDEIVRFVMDSDAQGSGVAEAVLQSWSGAIDRVLIQPRYEQVRASQSCHGRNRSPKVGLTPVDVSM